MIILPSTVNKNSIYHYYFFSSSIYLIANLNIFILWFLDELDVFSRVFCTSDKAEIIDSDVMNKFHDYSFGTVTRETQTGTD